VFWQIAESLRLQPATALPAGGACLFTTPTQPDVRSAAGRACPVPVGEPSFRIDCAAAVVSPTTMALSAFDYDLASGNSTGAAQLAPRDGACGASVPVGDGFALSLPRAGLTDLVAAVDFVATSPVRAYVGLATRRSGGDEVYSTFDTMTGDAGVWQKRSGQTLRVSSALVAHESSAVHRLVLSMNGGRESAWLDDRSISDTGSVSVTQSGAVEVYFGNRDSGTAATFDILRFVVYQPPAAG